MKRLIFVMCVALMLGGCAAAPTDSTQAAQRASAAAAQSASETNGVVEIRERMFIGEVNDIYANADDYIGKSIRYQGVFEAQTYGENLMFYSVIRYGPGCCGDDGNVGFEVISDAYPAQGAWVEVTGVLERYIENGERYLRLRASEMKEMSERGNPYVQQ